MTQTLPIALDVGPAQGLSRYFQAINEAPMLSQQEEKDLARRYSCLLYTSDAADE